MCFVNDYDWTPSLVEESDPVAKKDIRCNECGVMIKAGETYHHIWMQEHEECDRCFDPNGNRDEPCDCPVEKDEDGNCNECKCEKPYLGEDFAYNRCQECEKFLQAVSEAEIESGCRSWEARPSLCSMIEEIQNADDDGKRYFKKALVKFPELKASGYLGRIGKMIFAR